MAEPTVQESSRIMLRLLSAGTVKRLDILHQALCVAYRTGAADTERRMLETAR